MTLFVFVCVLWENGSGLIWRLLVVCCSQARPLIKNDWLLSFVLSCVRVSE